jgi:integrase
LRVGKAKTAAGTGREIPMNADLVDVLASDRSWFSDRFGELNADHYVFPFGSRATADPARYLRDIKTSWQNLKRRTGIDCRFHDLRHTVATKMAEAGISESTMLALLGHMSRAMLERYSHVRMAAKRKAVEALCLPKPTRVPTLSPTIKGSINLCN